MDYFKDYSVQNVLKDFYGRRHALRDALEIRVHLFNEKLLTARKANVGLSLYAAPNGTWFFLREDEVVPMGLPRPPVLVELDAGMMNEQEFINHVAKMSDDWLLEVLYFIGNKSKGINPLLLRDMSILLPEILENDEDSDEDSVTSKSPKGFDSQSGKATCVKSLDKSGNGTAIVDENPHTCELKNSNKGNEAHSRPEIGTFLDPLVSTKASHTSACLQDDTLLSVSEGLETEGLSTSTCDLFAESSHVDHCRRRKVPKALTNSCLWDDQQTNGAHPAKRVRELSSSHAEGISRASVRRNKS